MEVGFRVPASFIVDRRPWFSSPLLEPIDCDSRAQLQIGPNPSRGRGRNWKG